MRVRWLAVLGLATAVAVTGCSKKEEPASAPSQAEAPSGQQEMPASHPPVGGEGSGGTMGESAPAAPRQVVVPDEVTNTWKAVVLEVTDKESGKSQDVTVDIGQSATVDGLEVTVENFLPSFSMGGGQITSKSAATDNPAVQLEVKEGGTEVFSGWLFSLYPDAHPFQHDKYSILLKDFVKK